MAGSLKQNSIYNLASRSIEFTTSIITAFLIIRYLGKIGYGKYSIILAVVSAAAPMVDMGLSPILIREIVTKRIHVTRTIRSGLMLRGFAAFLAILLLGLWGISGGIDWLSRGTTGQWITPENQVFHTDILINLCICVLSIICVRGILVKTRLA